MYWALLLSYVCGRALSWTFVFFAVSLDAQNQKCVVDVRDIRLSRHKDVHPDDSEAPEDIGLSSEEEAEDLEDNPAICRKYHHSAPPATSATTTGGTATATTSTATGPEMATVQIPVAALQKVHDLLGKMLEGQLPSEPQQSAQQDVPGEVPFSVSKPKRGDKKCTICFRTFWSTDSLKRHLKSHTGKQTHICTNPGCGRKLSSKRSLEQHLTTCQKEKTKFCKRAGCKKVFATKEALRAHLATHITLKGDAAKCKGCGKDGFSRQKSLNDHYRYCDGNPDRVGPFPCPVAGCRRGKDNPFRRTRNLNVHLKDEHGYDPKHV